MRRKKNIVARMAACQMLMVQPPQAWQSRWERAFDRPQPIHLEIGCGKGRFVIEMAKAHPNVNFLAMEREENVLITAMEKTIAEPLPNLLFIHADASMIREYFSKGELARIYLNFSDPWPPNKQAKRRLTHRAFLDAYQSVLMPGGELHFKTDNQKFFEFTLMELSARQWRLVSLSLNLHQADLDNILTEYEERFSLQGMPIYLAKAQKPLVQMN